MTIGAPITGWLADRETRQLPFLAGLVIAAAATLLLCFGTALWVLVIARLLQGFAASVVYTAGLALIADTVDAKQVGSWIGFVLSGMNLGALIAPFLAGIVYAKVGYYAVFGMILGLIGVDFILRGVMIEKRTARKWFPEDKWSPSTAAFDSGNGSEVSEDTSTTEVASSSPASGDEHDEMQSDSPTETSPLLKKSWGAKKSQSWFRRRFPRMATLLDSSRMRAAFFGCFTHTTLTACFDTILPLFVKRTFHWNSAGAGLIFLCLTVPTVLGTFVGQLSDRFGPRKMALIGFILTIPTLALMGLIQDDAIESKVGLCVLLVLVGIGLNFILTPLATEMSHEVDILTKKHPEVFGSVGAYAQAYCFFVAALGAATVVGPLWSGFIYDQLGWEVTAASMALLCACGSIPVLKYTGGSVKHKSGDVETSNGA